MTGYYVLKRSPDGSIRNPDVVYLDRVNAERNCCSDRGESVCEVRIEPVDVLEQYGTGRESYSKEDIQQIKSILSILCDDLSSQDEIDAGALRQDRIDPDEYLRREV